MAEGAPDYTKLVQILGRDVDGNLVAVRVDPYGRIILLPYGTTTVEGAVDVTQLDSNRVIEGTEGQNIRPIVVDNAGRLIMMPYGTTTVAGTATVTQVDKDRIMEGTEGQNIRPIIVDTEGRMIMVPYGFDGANYRILKVDEEGRMVSVMKGQADVTWELHGWWKFIASEALIVKDYSGYGNNLDAHSGGNGAANYVDGVIAQALQFNGVDAYVGLSADPSLSFPGAMSIELWMKTSTSQASRMVRMDGDVGTYGYYMLSMGATLVAFATYDRAATNFSPVEGTTSVADGEWHHIVGTTDRVHNKIYIDGVLEATVDDDTSDPLGVGDFCIGAANGTAEFFTGLLDEVRVYNRCLSQDEVSWRYGNTNPATGKPTRMVAVDNEGRMMVNIQDLPYKDQVLERGAFVQPGAGSKNLQSSVVPSGKLWVITSAMMHASGILCSSMDIGIYDGTDNFIIQYEYGAGAIFKAQIKGQLIVKAGDRLNFAWGSIAGATSLEWCINGYLLDV